MVKVVTAVFTGPLLPQGSSIKVEILSVCPLLLKNFQSCISYVQSCNPLNPVNLKIWRLPACLPKMRDGLPFEGLDCYFGLWRQIDGFGQICHQWHNCRLPRDNRGWVAIISTFSSSLSSNIMIRTMELQSVELWSQKFGPNNIFGKYWRWPPLLSS